jgi:ubiquinone/menaquinone biosynthesis C-methylase UbiE
LKSDNAEKIVSNFYNTVGWETEKGITEDAKRFEDLRQCAQNYVSKCRLRILRHIPISGDSMLDMASGPIQYKEYLEYSSNYRKRYCVDLSQQALDAAREKIGDHGEFLLGSIFDIPLKKDFFDCVVSLHTIYHIDKDKQDEVVRKLVEVVKPGKPVIIIYSNPDGINSRLGWIKKILNYRPRLICDPKLKEESSSLYFYPHELKWWNRFNDIADVKILPWRTFGTNIQTKIFPNNAIGSKLFTVLFFLEDKFPNFFVKFSTYPMVILTKFDTKD